MAKRSFDQVPGDTITEKCRHIGIQEGDLVDIRTLEKVMKKYDLLVVVYFEEDLARKSRYENDLETWKRAGEHERPFINVDTFLEIQREMNPLLDDALQDIPLMVEIITIRTYHHGNKPLIIGLLPFTDEIHVE